MIEVCLQQQVAGGFANELMNQSDAIQPSIRHIAWLLTIFARSSMSSLVAFFVLIWLSTSFWCRFLRRDDRRRSREIEPEPEAEAAMPPLGSNQSEKYCKRKRKWI